jgi:hypothetical protein
MNRFIPLLAACSAALAMLAGQAWATDAAPVIPAGTHINVRLTTTLSTRANQVGDPFTGQTEDPIFAGGQEAVPSGSTIEGHVAYVQQPTRTKKVAEMRLVIDGITTSDGKHYVVAGGLQDKNGVDGSSAKDSEGTLQGQGKDKKQAAKDAGIGTAVGAGVGVLAAGGTGAMYGAAAGALIGALHVLGKKHKDLVLHPGTELSFVLDRAAKPGPNTSKDSSVFIYHQPDRSN